MPPTRRQGLAAGWPPASRQRPRALACWHAPGRMSRDVRPSHPRPQCTRRPLVQILIVIVPTPQPVQATADFIRNSCGTAISVAGDVTDPALPAQLVATAVEHFGGLHILVNCAGERLGCGSSAAVCQPVRWHKCPLLGGEPGASAAAPAASCSGRHSGRCSLCEHTPTHAPWRPKQGSLGTECCTRCRPSSGRRCWTFTAPLPSASYRQEHGRPVGCREPAEPCFELSGWHQPCGPAPYGNPLCGTPTARRPRRRTCGRQPKPRLQPAGGHALAAS